MFNVLEISCIKTSSSGKLKIKSSACFGSILIGTKRSLYMAFNSDLSIGTKKQLDY